MASSSNSSSLQQLLDGPALKPPPGIKPQLDNPPSLSTVAKAIPILTLTIATLAISMRIFTKLSVARKLNVADCSILIAWIVFAAYTAIALLSGVYAPGVHQWDLRLRNLGPFLYYVHVGSVMYGICIFFIKLSILLQYIQLFMPGREPKALYWTTIFLVGINFIFYFASTFIEIFACKPIAKAWDPLITEGHCIDILAVNVAASFINTLSDISILALPQFIIWRLNMSYQNKLAVSIIFFIAIIACASSIIRLAYAIVLQHHDDISYYTWFTGVWTLPEMSGGILVACLPVARIFYQLVSQSRTASRVAVLFSKITSRSTLETIESSSTRVASNSGSTTQQHERYKTTPKQGKSWMKAYGVTSTLFSRAESDSVTGLRSESHDSPFDHDIYQPSEVHRRDGVERTAGNAYSQSHGQSFELGSVAPAG